MTISKVQGNARGTANTGNVVSVTMAANPTQNNTLIATIGCMTSKVVSSITQTGVTWDANPSVVKSISGLNAYIWRGVVGESAATAITVNLSGNMAAHEGTVVNVNEYSESGGAYLVLDDNITAYANGSSTKDGDTGTTDICNVNDELFIGTIMGSSDVNCNQSNPTLGFTLFDGVKYYRQGNVYYVSSSLLQLIVTAAQTGHTHVSFTASSNFWACIGAFKASINAISKTLTDKLGGLDSLVGKIKARLRTKTDKIGLVDTKVKHKGLYKTLTDKLGSLESYSRLIGHLTIKTLTNLIGLMDSKLRHISRLKTLTNKLGVIDTKIKNVARFRTFINLLGIKDSKTKMIARLKTFTVQLVGLKDSISSITKTLHRIFTNVLGAKHTFWKQKFTGGAQDIVKELSDILGVIDSKTNIISRIRLFLDKIGAKDSKTNSHIYIKILLDKLGLKDSKFVSYVSGTFRWIWKEHPKVKVEKQ